MHEAAVVVSVETLKIPHVERVDRVLRRKIAVAEPSSVAYLQSTSIEPSTNTICDSHRGCIGNAVPTVGAAPKRPPQSTLRKGRRST